MVSDTAADREASVTADKNESAQGAADEPLYESPVSAIRAVRERYEYWSAQLTSSSFQLSLALIAANWAVFGSTDALFKNWWALASITTVLLCLWATLVGTARLAEAIGSRIAYAEKDRAAWAHEFKSTAHKDDPWPYSPEIVNLARQLRWAKTWLPTLGGAFFVFAICAAV